MDERVFTFLTKNIIESRAVCTVSTFLVWESSAKFYRKFFHATSFIEIETRVFSFTLRFQSLMIIIDKTDDAKGVTTHSRRQPHTLRVAEDDT